MLLFVLHVELNLNSQRHNNAHLTTIVSFLMGNFSGTHYRGSTVGRDFTVISKALIYVLGNRHLPRTKL